MGSQHCPGQPTQLRPHSRFFALPAEWLLNRLGIQTGEGPLRDAVLPPWGPTVTPARFRRENSPSRTLVGGLCCFFFRSNTVLTPVGPDGVTQRQTPTSLLRPFKPHHTVAASLERRGSLLRAQVEAFVGTMRAALESEHVSKGLPKWIDLIFGCTQRGPAAEHADNLFLPPLQPAIQKYN